MQTEGVVTEARLDEAVKDQYRLRCAGTGTYVDGEPCHRCQATGREPQADSS